MRDQQLVILKGLGIIFVVAGHASSPLTAWIFTFHMPLFFFVSGFLRFSAPTIPWRTFLRRKATSILIPYVVFWFISVVVYANILSLVQTHQLYPFGMNQIKGLLLSGHWLSDSSYNFPLWYLQHFFIAVIAFELIIRYFNKPLKIAVFVFLMWVTLPFQAFLPGRPAFHINVFPAALSFMLMGYGFHALLAKKNVPWLKHNIVIGALLLIAGYLISTIHYGNISRINSYLYFIGALCTIIGLYIFSGKLTASKILLYLGANTLFILGLHNLTLRHCLRLADLIFETLRVDLPLLENTLAIAISLALCCGAAELYRFCRKTFARPQA